MVRLKLPDPLNEDEIIQLLKASLKKIKDHLIIRVLLDGGLRAEEIVNLRVKDINFNKDPVEVKVYGKGREGRKKERIVYLSSVTAKKLKNFILSKDMLRDDYVFLSQRGQYTTAGIWHVIKKYGKVIKRDRLFPHLLRHTCACRLLEEGFDLKYIQQYLGHEHISTTFDVYSRYPTKSMAEGYKKIGGIADYDI